jgi:oligopeptide/dipeptide ABC transporter ATP-binding protein
MEPHTMHAEAPLLEIASLRVAFGEGAAAVPAVSGADVVVHRGEIVALVGESGSGKSVTALSVARLLDEPPARITGGSIRLGGHEMTGLSGAALRAVRGTRVAYVFQEPGAALNPVFRTGWQIREALRQHRIAGDHHAEVERLLRAVGLPDTARIAAAYPHQLSGGQQQRVMLAMALACRPDLLIADEPTTALDVTVQAQILDLLREVQQERGMAVLLITHNLAVAARLAQRLVIMYAGEMVESGPADRVLCLPRHPYTRALLAAVPRLRGGQGVLTGIPGQLPEPGETLPGCRFAPRCARARDTCRVAPVPMRRVDRESMCRCLYWDEVAR